MMTRAFRRRNQIHLPSPPVPPAFLTPCGLTTAGLFQAPGRAGGGELWDPRFFFSGPRPVCAVLLRECPVQALRL